MGDLPELTAEEKLAAFDWVAGLYDDRELTRDDIAVELADLRMIASEVSCVYDHVTGGKVSKPTTMASVVKSLADEHYSEIEAENREGEIEHLEAKLAAEREVSAELLEALKAALPTLEGLADDACNDLGACVQEGGHPTEAELSGARQLVKIASDAGNAIRRAEASPSPKSEASQ